MNLTKIFLCIVFILAILLTLRLSGVFVLDNNTSSATQLEPPVASPAKSLPTTSLSVVPHIPYRIGFLRPNADYLSQWYSASSGTVNVDGSNQRLVDTGTRPMWAPDGKKIAYISGYAPDDGIYVMNEEGTNKIIVSGNNKYYMTYGPPIWSPDSNKLAILVGDDNWGLVHIDILCTDGREPQMLTASPWGHRNEEPPTWSPDGTKIAFVDEGDIYSIGTAGGPITRLTYQSMHASSPRWSPDGTRIAYLLSNSAESSLNEIWIVDFDGSKQIQLTNFQAHINDLAWSPDGSHMAITISRENNYQIYVVNCDNGSKLNPPEQLTEGMNPAWSPDGKWISFASKNTGTFRIYIIDINGNNRKQLTNSDDKANDILPIWIPK